MSKYVAKKTISYKEMKSKILEEDDYCKEFDKFDVWDPYLSMHF